MMPVQLGWIGCNQLLELITGADWAPPSGTARITRCLKQENRAVLIAPCLSIGEQNHATITRGVMVKPQADGPAKANRPEAGVLTGEPRLLHDLVKSVVRGRVLQAFVADDPPMLAKGARGYFPNAADHFTEGAHQPTETRAFYAVLQRDIELESDFVSYIASLASNGSSELADRIQRYVTGYRRAWELTDQ